MACNCNDLSASLTAINNKVDALMKENATLKAQVSDTGKRAEFLGAEIKYQGTKVDGFSARIDGVEVGYRTEIKSSREFAVNTIEQGREFLESLIGRAPEAVSQSDIAILNKRIDEINRRFQEFQRNEANRAIDKKMAEYEEQWKSTERKLADEIRTRQKETAEAIKLAKRADELSQKTSEKVDKVRRDLEAKVDTVKSDLGQRIDSVSKDLFVFKGKVEAKFIAVEAKISAAILSNKALAAAAAYASATATTALGAANLAMAIAAGAAGGVAGLLINVTALTVQMNQLRRVDAELRGAIAQGQQDHLQNLSAIAGLTIRMRQLEALARMAARGVDITAFNSAINKLNADLSSLGRNFTTQLDGLRQADKLFATKQDLAGLKQALLTGAIATVGGIAASALATAAIAKLTAGAANVTANSALRLAQQRPAPVNQTIYIDRTRTIDRTKTVNQTFYIDRTRTIDQTKTFYIDRTRTINQSDPRLSGRVSALERVQSAFGTAQAALAARLSGLQQLFSRQTNPRPNAMDTALLQQIFNQTKQNNLAINATRTNVLNNGVVLNNTAQKVNVVDQKIGVFPAKSTIRIAGSETGQTQEVEFQNLTEATQQAIISANNAEANLGVPFKTPDTLINNPVNPTKNHLDFASILSWWIYQMDALVGEFPIKLQIEDSDLMKVGDQTLNLEFPNIAETLAELMGLAINTKTVTEANIDASMRTLMETGSGRKQAIANGALLEAIQDYLGFSSRQKMIDVPFTYSPVDAVTDDSISTALNPSIQKVKVEENTDPDTLEKRMAALMESARIIKAVHTRKLSPDSVEEWKQTMRAARDQVRKTDPNNQQDDFDKFLEQVEQGWATEAATDPTTPYDRNYEQRPRIRKLDSVEDQNNGV